MRDHEEITIGADPEVKPSVDEFYVWLFGSYLPTRFPSMFQLQSSPHSPSIKEDFVLNLVTSEEISLHPPLAITDCLRMIGSHVDDDFLFLLPSPDGDGYSLQSYVTCFPSGFNTKEKLYLKLRDIHHQVPGYKKKLGKSMDRFFDRIEVGRFVKRTNVVDPHTYSQIIETDKVCDSGLSLQLINYSHRSEPTFMRASKPRRKILILIRLVHVVLWFTICCYSLLN